MKSVIGEKFENHDLIIQGLFGRVGQTVENLGKDESRSSKQVLKELLMFEEANARPCWKCLLSKHFGNV